MGNNYFKTIGDSVVPKTLKKTLSDLSELSIYMLNMIHHYHNQK